MENKNKPGFSVKAIPGWVVVPAIFGVLYFTGLHTEVIGQVQRILLASGIKKANIPEQFTPSTAASSEKAGKGFILTDMNGQSVPFESLHGKVIFVNIWATWCPPCRAEMPNIQSLYEKMDPDKVAFVMLSVDEGGPEKVKKFIDKKGFTFPVYMPAGQMPQEFHSQAIPTTYIIAPDGSIVARQEGMADYDTEEVQAFLQSMAK